MKHISWFRFLFGGRLAYAVQAASSQTQSGGLNALFTNSEPKRTVRAACLP